MKPASPFRAAPWLALLCLPAFAQQGLQTITVTGNPLGRDVGTQPVTSLGGEALARRRAASLGDTLDGLPGVASSGFGPNAGRPVLRGLDGERVRLLDNGGAALDASNLSFDHAPALDPLVVDRIELLRGPAALLYGGNATGGVVNVLDNRIPRSRSAGLAGRAELRLGGAASAREAALVLDGGGGAGGAGGEASPWAWHADAMARRQADARTPLGRTQNSAAQASAGAVGAAWFGAGGARLGASLQTLQHDYGVTVEPDVSIRLQRQRLGLAGEWPLAGAFEQLSFTAGHTRYGHDEVEGDGKVGTRFASRGRDLRLQLRQARAGAWQGVLGLQAEALRFSALGEEAFVPATRTRSQALFALQRWEQGAWLLEAGARAEQVRVASDGDAAGAAAPRFGAAQQRRFSPLSASLGLRWTPASAWALTASLGRTERAPAYHELYANGPHLATAAYERGDTTLGTERSAHAELGLRWASQGRELKAQLFHTRFARYLALDATGQAVDGLPEYAYRGVAARLHGLELEGHMPLPSLAGWQLGLQGTADVVRGVQADSGAPLPRLAPWRASLLLAAQQGAWRWGLEVRHLGAQQRVAAFDTPTAAATLAHLWLGWQQALGDGRQALWRLKLDNLGHALAYNAAAVPTVRALSPLAGRSLSASVRVDF